MPPACREKNEGKESACRIGLSWEERVAGSKNEGRVREGDCVHNGQRTGRKGVQNEWGAGAALSSLAFGPPLRPASAGVGLAASRWCGGGRMGRLHYRGSAPFRGWGEPLLSRAPSEGCVYRPPERLRSRKSHCGGRGAKHEMVGEEQSSSRRRDRDSGCQGEDGRGGAVC